MIFNNLYAIWNSIKNTSTCNRKTTTVPPPQFWKKNWLIIFFDSRLNLLIQSSLLMKEIIKKDATAVEDAHKKSYSYRKKMGLISVEFGTLFSEPWYLPFLSLFFFNVSHTNHTYTPHSITNKNVKYSQTLQKKRYKFEYIHEIGPRWFILGTCFFSFICPWWYYTQTPVAMAKYLKLAEATNDSSLKFLYLAAYWQFIINLTIGTIGLFSSMLILRIVKYKYNFFCLCVCLWASLCVFCVRQNYGKC